MVSPMLSNQPIRSITKSQQTKSKRIRPTQRQLGDISNKVRQQVRERSGGACEICRRARAMEMAHIVGRKQLTRRTTVDDLLHLCVACHRWLDGTPAGIKYKKVVVSEIERTTGEDDKQWT